MAVWSRKYVDKLPDSAFLLVLPGGKRERGRTHPLHLRKLPVRDMAGRPNAPHIRNAIARAPQVKGISERKALELQERARCMLEKHFPAGRPVARDCKLRSTKALERELARLQTAAAEADAELKQRASRLWRSGIAATDAKRGCGCGGQD